MRSIGARGTSLSSALEGGVGPSWPAGQDGVIVLIDRRPLTRQCLRRWLQDESPDRHVASVASPADLLAAAPSRSTADIVVFSIGAASVVEPEVLGMITLLRRHLSRVPLVLLTDRDDLDDIVAALEQGVRGYITTSLEPSQAAAALHCVVAGGTFVPADAMIKLAQDRQHRSRQPGERETSPFEHLTPRESEVLARLQQGKPNKIIAHELAISENTVKVFVGRILTKLSVSNRTEIALVARSRADSGSQLRGLGSEAPAVHMLRTR
jgi:DNA-binding NarL/FixJ family response regulator